MDLILTFRCLVGWLLPILVITVVAYLPHCRLICLRRCYFGYVAVTRRLVAPLPIGPLYAVGYVVATLPLRLFWFAFCWLRTLLFVALRAFVATLPRCHIYVPDYRFTFDFIYG